MHTDRHNLFTRPDTFFGACQGFGEDTGLHPNILRLAIAGLMFVNPYAAIASYVALGAVVGLSRLLFPTPAPLHIAATSSSEEASERLEPRAPDVTPSDERVLLAA